jgi:hypothetical protein
MIDTPLPLLVRIAWANLGPDLDRDDPSWEVHYEDSPPNVRSQEIDKAPTTQSPHTYFEIVSDLSYEAFRDRNLSYLRGKRFKKSKHFV